MAYWAMCMFFATCAAVGVSIWAVTLLHKTLKATRAVVKETQTATAAAQERALSVRRTERAYIYDRNSLSSVRVEQFLEHATKNTSGEKGHRIIDPEFYVGATNFGKAPGEVIDIYADADIGQPSDKPVYNRGIITGGNLVLGVGDDNANLTGKAYKIPLKQFVSSTDAQEISDGAKSLRFYMRIRYKDIFGDRHETTYYWYYNGTLNQVEPCHAAGPEYNRRT